MSGEPDHMILRVPGRKPIKLKPGTVLRIGRHQSNDLVINDTTVSRFHCSIEWDKDDSAPWLVDNESANGCDVDGLEVDGKALLAKDTVIGVGDVVLSMTVKHATQRMAKAEDSATAALIEDGGSAVVKLFSESNKHVKGKISSAVDLERLLLELEKKERTGTLKIMDGNRTAALMFGMGKLVSAKRGEESGYPVLERIFQLSSFAFDFGPEVEPSEENMNLSFDEYLREQGEQTSFLQRPAND